MDDPYAALVAPPFLLSIVGSFDSCVVATNAPIYCRWSVVHGDQWKIISGTGHGITQRSSISDGQHAFAFPIEATLVSDDIDGWPQLSLTVYQSAMIGDDSVIGYGSAVIPLAPGAHTLTLPLFTPLSSSAYDTFLASIGLRPVPEFFDPSFAARSHGREVTRVKAEGKAKFAVNVQHRSVSGSEYR